MPINIWICRGCRIISICINDSTVINITSFQHFKLSWRWRIVNPTWIFGNFLYSYIYGTFCSLCLCMLLLFLLAIRVIGGAWQLEFKSHSNTCCLLQLLLGYCWLNTINTCQVFCDLYSCSRCHFFYYELLIPSWYRYSVSWKNL